MSLYRDGLPEWLFAPRMAVATGMAVAFMITATFSLAHGVASIFEPDAPACFWSRKPAYLPGGTKDNGGRPPIAPDHYWAKQVIEKALLCDADSCAPEDQDALRHAAWEYMNERLHMTRVLDKIAGDQGLAEARYLFNSNPDQLAVEALVARIEDGLIDLDRMSQHEEGLRILVHKGADALVPCRGEVVAEAEAE